MGGLISSANTKQKVITTEKQKLRKNVSSQELPSHNILLYGSGDIPASHWLSEMDVPLKILDH
jgi:hypothetical protein